MGLQLYKIELPDKRYYYGVHACRDQACSYWSLKTNSCMYSGSGVALKNYSLEDRLAGKKTIATFDTVAELSKAEFEIIGDKWKHWYVKGEGDELCLNKSPGGQLGYDWDWEDIKKSGPRNTTQLITKDEETIEVDKSELLQYLDDGWDIAASNITIRNSFLQLTARVGCKKNMKSILLSDTGWEVGDDCMFNQIPYIELTNMIDCDITALSARIYLKKDGEELATSRRVKALTLIYEHGWEIDIDKYPPGEKIQVHSLELGVTVCLGPAQINRLFSISRGWLFGRRTSCPKITSEQLQELVPGFIANKMHQNRLINVQVGSVIIKVDEPAKVIEDKVKSGEYVLPQSDTYHLHNNQTRQRISTRGRASTELIKAGWQFGVVKAYTKISTKEALSSCSNPNREVQLSPEMQKLIENLKGNNYED